MSRRSFLSTLLSLAACAQASSGVPEGPPPEPGVKGLPTDPDTIEKLVKSNEEWKTLLDAQTYDVLREAGTERAFSGRYWNNHLTGAYHCSGCNLRLFKSEDKFESGTGWPSFTRPVKEDRLRKITDASLGMVRVEVRCARCDGHLGHVFDDGPAPTGLRYCMNSVSLIFRGA